MINTMLYLSMLGTTEMILAVVAVAVLFPGNLSKLGQSLGSGIRNFRQSMQGDDQLTEQDPPKKLDQQQTVENPKNEAPEKKIEEKS